MTNYEYWFEKLMIFKAEEPEMIIKLDKVIAAMGYERAKQGIKNKADLEKALLKLQVDTDEKKTEYNYDRIFKSIEDTIQQIIQTKVLGNANYFDGKFSVMDADRIDIANSKYNHFAVINRWGKVRFDEGKKPAIIAAIKKRCENRNWINGSTEIWNWINKEPMLENFLLLLLSDIYSDFHNWECDLVSLIDDDDFMNKQIKNSYSNFLDFILRLNKKMASIERVKAAMPINSGV